MSRSPHRPDSVFARLSLSSKLLLPILLAVGLGLAVSTVLITTESQTIVEALSTTAGQEMAGHIAAQIENDLTKPLQIARTLGDTFVQMQQSGVTDRAVYLAMLRHVAATNREYIGAWTVWDSRGFGALVADPDGSTQGSNPDGSFSPYAVNHASGTTVQVLDDYSTAGPGDYYLAAHASGHETVTEPYHYKVDDTDHLITSIAVPIVVNGRTIGVLGLDAALDGLSERFGSVRPYGTGSVMVLSNSGLVVAAPNRAHLGDPADKLAASLDGVQSRIAAGEAFRRSGWADTIHADAVEIFVPINVGESKPWSVVVSLPKSALMAPVRRISFYAAGVSVTVLAIVALLVMQIVRRLITQPMRTVAESIEAVSSGHTDRAIPMAGRADELGVMARAIDLFRRNLIEVAALQQRETESKAAAEADKRRTLSALADAFERTVRKVVEAVGGAATSLADNAQALAAGSETSTREAASVASLTTLAAGNVAGVAQASEALTASIHEITRQIIEGSAAMRLATSEVEHIAKIASGLTDAAGQVGGVVQMISKIASQTNLLALNATIEAARAGDAGKGFAVVASEVKALATQTAKATQDIASQIEAIQAATQTSVDAIQGITVTIGAVNEATASIAAAVEQQGAATREISRNVAEAASGTQDATATVAGVSASAANTGQAAGQVLGSAGELNRDSEALRTQVEAFLRQVRAA